MLLDGSIGTDDRDAGDEDFLKGTVSGTGGGGGGGGGGSGGSGKGLCCVTVGGSEPRSCGRVTIVSIFTLCNKKLKLKWRRFS